MSTHTSQTSKAVKVSNPNGFAPEQIKDLSRFLNALLADVFALYLKTKNFHWHMSEHTSATITCCSTSTLTRS